MRGSPRLYAYFYGVVGKTKDVPLKLISASGKLYLQGEVTLFDPLLSDYSLEDLADMLLETRTDWSELFPEAEEFLNSVEFLSCLDDFECDGVDSGQGGHVNFGYEESEKKSVLGFSVAALWDMTT